MKVCIVVPRFDPSKGKPAFYIARELRKIGHDVTVITSNLEQVLNKRITIVDELESIKTIRLSGFVLKKKVFIPSSIVKLLTIDTDVFQLDGFGHLITTYASWIGRIRNIPVVLRADWSGQNIISRGLKGLYDRHIKFPTLINSNIITVFSKEQKQKMMSYKLNPKKIITLPNGVDYERFTKARKNDYLRKKFSIDKSTKILLCVSRLVPSKDLEFAIQAVLEVRKRHKVSLVIVGLKSDRKYYRKLLSLAKKLKVENYVFFHPEVQHKNMQKIYAAADIFALTTKPFGEGMNLSTLEAMASGLPIITTSVNVTSNFVREAKCGFIVDNLNSFIEALKTLIKDENLRMAMGKNARKFVKKYSWNNIVSEINKIYKKLIKETE